MLASSSSFFSWHRLCQRLLSDVRPSWWSSTFLFSGPFVHFKNGRKYLTRGTSWKISLWIFTPAKVFPPAVYSTYQFFYGLRDKFYSFLGYLVPFQRIYHPGLREHIGLFVINPHHGFSASLCTWSIRVYLLLLGIYSVEEPVCREWTGMF